LASGHYHSPEGNVTFREDEVFIAALTDDAFELVESRARADDGQTVIKMNYGRVGRGPRFLTVADA
jgi:hypothetical protein